MSETSPTDVLTALADRSRRTVLAAEWDRRLATLERIAEADGASVEQENVDDRGRRPHGCHWSLSVEFDAPESDSTDDSTGRSGSGGRTAALELAL